MHIESTLAGTKLSGRNHEVTARETMNYAAAVGDMNTHYFDDSSEQGVVAPPLFAVALTWPIMQDLPRQVGDTLPPEVIATIVHANEHLIFHRPVRPGDRLRLSGQIAAVMPTSAGTLMTLRVDAAGDRDEPVFTEFAGAMFRGVPCADAGSGKENLPVLPPWEEPSAALWGADIPVERRAPYLYDGCTNIVFPIHTSAAFARMVGLPDIILQGTATLAMACQEILEWEFEGNPVLLREIACRFTGTVVPGGSIRAEVTRREREGKDTLLGFRVLNQDARPALEAGFARIRRP